MLYLLTVLTIVAMAVVSFFLRFEMPREPGALDRVIGLVPIHLFTLLTILLPLVGLNPRIATVVPFRMVGVLWTALAGLNLAIVGGIFGYQLVSGGTRRLAGAGSPLSWTSKVN